MSLRLGVPLLLLVLLAPAASAAEVSYYDGREPEDPTDWGRLGVSLWVPPDSRVGEQAFTAELRCASRDEDPSQPCRPEHAFVGGHFVPLGQDLRAHAGTPWRSAGLQARLDAAEHEADARAGTFWFWQLQYYYLEVDADGERVVGVFDAFPMPV